MTDDLAADLVAERRLPEVVPFVEQLPSLWPPASLKKAEATQAALDERLGAVMKHLPADLSTPFY